MASAVVGSMLMLGLTLSLLPGAIILFNNLGDAMDAQADRAEQAAWCARHPEYTGEDCPMNEEGFICEEGPGGSIVCVKRGEA